MVRTSKNKAWRKPPGASWKSAVQSSRILASLSRLSHSRGWHEPFAERPGTGDLSFFFKVFVGVFHIIMLAMGNLMLKRE